MAIFFNATPNREADESTPLLSGKKGSFYQFSYFDQDKKQELIQSIEESESFFKEIFNCTPIALRHTSPLHQLDCSQLVAIFQDIRAEIASRKAVHNFEKNDGESSSPVLSENIIWIDAEYAERKARSRTKEENVETGTKTSQELAEIKEAALEDLDEKNAQIMCRAKKRDRNGAKSDRQTEEWRVQEQQDLERRVEKRLKDPRYRTDLQFYQKTMRLAEPFLEDQQTETEVKEVFQKFVEESGYNRYETELVVLRRESRNPEAYGPVRILNSMREEFYTLHAESDGRETWLEQMQEKLNETARIAAEIVAAEVHPTAVHVYSQPCGNLKRTLRESIQAESSSKPKKKVQFSEVVEARVIFPGDINGDSEIDLETMNLEDNPKW